MNTFFTADTHFGHANIILYANRPFLDRNTDLDERGKWISKEVACRRSREMDETLIANWNSVVRKGDTVYHMGDFAFGFCRDLNPYLDRLNGNIHWIPGNHEKAAWLVKHRFVSHSPLMEVKVRFSKEVKLVVLCHYAMRVWNKSHWGSYHLYGHSHGTLEDLNNSLSFDVGVDCHNLYPVSAERVEEIMSKKEFRPIDHHGRGQETED